MTTHKTGDVQAKNASQESARDEAAGVDPVLQGSIGRKLRDAYQEVVNEDVPPKFLALLQELKKKEAGSGGGQS
jgi:hypothetical protein